MGQKMKKSWLKSIYEKGHISLVLIIILALFIRIAVFEPFLVPSGSMKPTLVEGDYIFVYKLPYGISKNSIPFAPFDFKGRYFVYSEPQKGDIIVFKDPKGSGIYYVKRLIGLPGDRIRLINGELFVNDILIKKTAEGYYRDEFNNTELKREREFLDNGASYFVLNSYEESLADNTNEFIVPDKHYFMMGDNRDHSNDSRLGLGFIPEDFVIGKAEYVIFSDEFLAEPSLDLLKIFSGFKASRLFKNLYKN